MHTGKAGDRAGRESQGVVGGERRPADAAGSRRVVPPDDTAMQFWRGDGRPPVEGDER